MPYFILFNRRGPNKYTRNWEDFDAYSKPSTRGGKREGGPTSVGRGRGGRRVGNINSEKEYPSLSFSKKQPPKETILNKSKCHNSLSLIVICKSFNCIYLKNAHFTAKLYIMEEFTSVRKYRVTPKFCLITLIAETTFTCFISKKYYVK